jgi:RNA polymerase sigma-70 factor (ECF subfamily)
VAPDAPDDADLIAQARAGHRLAFERLLVRHQRRLVERIGRRIPGRMRSLVDADDILQETFADGWQSLGDFRPAGPDAFFPWLLRIAENNLLDAVKAFRAAKRGGGWQRTPEDLDGELTQVLSLLAVHQRTPSRSVARHEALAAVQAALPGLKEDYREVLRLRFLEGMPVGDAATRMNRTEWAVQKLTARALASLREAMGDAARFLSHG